MKQAVRKAILKRLLMSIWGMLTLILVFCVVLLAREMINTGRDPLSALRAPNSEEAPVEAAVPYRPEMPGETQEVPLFFGSSDGRNLVPEVHALEVTDSTVENCRRALSELIAGPRDILTPILPPSARVRALYLLENGELVVDFSRDLHSEYARLKSASLEALLVYGVVNTLSQSVLQSKSDVPVRQIRFLVEGAPPQEAFPAHLDLRDPVKLDQRWCEMPSGLPAHG